jgi:hypothetical protein
MSSQEQFKLPLIYRAGSLLIEPVFTLAGANLLRGTVPKFIKGHTTRVMSQDRNIVNDDEMI